LPAPPTPGKDGKDGNSDDTDDHLLVPLPPLVPLGASFTFPNPEALTIPFFHSRFIFFSSGGLFDRVLGTERRGPIHLSRNLKTGISATTVACEFWGELGNGR
jgi:hypothetical protein